MSDYGRVVSKVNPRANIDTAIAQERAARLENPGGYRYRVARGDHDYYLAALARGDTAEMHRWAPTEEHWCDHCAGWYGVPHTIGKRAGVDTHIVGELCRSIGHAPGNPQCACIDCQVYAVWSAARRAQEARA